jgi:hypothetical protein
MSVVDKSSTFQRPSSLMMEMEMVSETLGFYPKLTRLVA